MLSLLSDDPVEQFYNSLPTDSEADTDESCSDEPEDLDTEEVWALYPNAAWAAEDAAGSGLDSEGDEDAPSDDHEQLGSASHCSHSCSGHSDSSGSDDEGDDIPRRGTPEYHKWLLQQPAYPGEQKLKAQWCSSYHCLGCCNDVHGLDVHCL